MNMVEFWTFGDTIRRGTFTLTAREVFDPATKNRVQIEAILTVNFRDAVIESEDLIVIDGENWEVKTVSSEDRFTTYGLVRRKRGVMP
jgi:hypothetical protein